MSRLQKLLGTLFEVAELKRLLATTDAYNLVDDIPTTVSPAAFFSEVTAALERRGLVDGDFFDLLLQTRPFRADEIWSVRSEWPGQEAASRLKEPPPSGPFVGRQSILATLEIRLAESPLVVLCGLRGIGTTRIAREYLKRLDARYQVTCELRGDSHPMFTMELARLARTLGLQGSRSLDDDRVARVARTWLKTHDRWLLLVDHVKDREVLGELLELRRGRVLVTSPRTGWEGWNVFPDDRIQVGQLTPDEAVEMLTALALRGDPDDLTALASDLGHIPLALTQAATSIRYLNLSVREYLAQLRSAAPRLLALGQAPDDTVKRTVLIAWDAVLAGLRAPARRLAHALAFLDASGVPRQPLHRHGEQLGVPDLHEPIAELAEVCLLSVVDRAGRSAITMHDLVQTVLRATMSDVERDSAARGALAWVDASFGFDGGIHADAGDPGTPEQVLAIAEHPACLAAAPELAAKLFIRAAEYYQLRGIQSAARALAGHAVRIATSLARAAPQDSARREALAAAWIRRGGIETCFAADDEALCCFDEARRHLDTRSPRLLAIVSMHEARIRRRRKQLTPARDLLGSAASLLLDPAIDPDTGRHDRSILATDLADLARATGDLEQAERHLEEALQLRAALAGSAGPLDRAANLDLSLALADLGQLAVHQGQWQPALVWFTRENTLLDALLRAYPGDARISASLTLCCVRTADVLHALGRATEATAALLVARALAMPTLAANPATADSARLDQLLLQVEHTLANIRLKRRF